MIDTPLNIFCKVFKDKKSCIIVAESKKPPIRTKHIVITYHHFRSLVDEKVIRINYIDTKDQIADILTKLIKNNQFFKLRYILMGW